MKTMIGFCFFALACGGTDGTPSTSGTPSTGISTGGASSSNAGGAIGSSTGGTTSSSVSAGGGTSASTGGTANANTGAAPSTSTGGSGTTTGGTPFPDFPPGRDCSMYPKLTADTLKVGMSAPNLETIDSYGRKFNLCDFAGKPILISLDASQCVSCVSFAYGLVHSGYYPNIPPELTDAVQQGDVIVIEMFEDAAGDVDGLAYWRDCAPADDRTTCTPKLSTGFKGLIVADDPPTDVNGQLYHTFAHAAGVPFNYYALISPDYKWQNLSSADVFEAAAAYKK